LSIRHGLGLLDQISSDGATELRRYRFENSVNDLDYRIYAYSEQEKSIYVEDLGAKPASVRVTGVPRLDRQGIRIIASDRKDEPARRSVFFISRSLGRQYFEFKRSWLRVVYTFALENNLGLVVRAHPSESLTEISGVLPELERGRSWELSAEHPQHIALKSIFAVSFMSSLPVELLSFDVPTIELGLGYDLNSRDMRLGFVVGASTPQEFRIRAQELLVNPDERIRLLQAARNQHYAAPDGALATIVDDMESLVRRI
jgi:hypothetical protein